MSITVKYYFIMNSEGKVAIKNIITGEAMFIDQRTFAEYIDKLWEEHF